MQASDVASFLSWYLRVAVACHRRRPNTWQHVFVYKKEGEVLREMLAFCPT